MVLNVNASNVWETESVIADFGGQFRSPSIVFGCSRTGSGRP
jgi:hypothetical protein